MRNCRIAYSLTFASGSPQVHPIRAKKVRRSRCLPAADVASGRAGWAFRPPRDTGVPPVRDTSWARDAVDRFILARLESKGLSPAFDADRHTWLRRVSLDLVGLPPSPEQIVEFLRDSSPAANERVVDRFLASPAFGERWARHWLDLTGYADQIGTANDIFAEHAWRYRDYVIAAPNTDRPFDRFIREQLAGDLLPYDTVQERAANLIATGFLVLGDVPVVEADKAKLRLDVVDQQVDKVGKAFLGLTLGCARCHDHKFDPIPLRDYYALAGIFFSTESVRKAEWGVWSWPTVAELPETPAEQTDRKIRLEQHRKAIAALKAERERAVERTGEIGTVLRGQGKGKERVIDRPTREALEKERRDLEARVKKLATDIEHAEFFTPSVPVAFAVHDSASPGGMRITIRGNAHALGDEVPRGFVRVVSQNRPAPLTARGERPSPTGRLDRERRQSVDGPDCREPYLAKAVRRGDRPLGRLLRKSRRDAHPPGAARRPRAAVRRERLVPEASDPKLGAEPFLRHEQCRMTAGPTRSILRIDCCGG